MKFFDGEISKTQNRLIIKNKKKQKTQLLFNQIKGIYILT